MRRLLLFTLLINTYYSHPAEHNQPVIHEIIETSFQKQNIENGQLFNMNGTNNSEPFQATLEIRNKSITFTLEIAKIYIDLSYTKESLEKKLHPYNIHKLTLFDEILLHHMYTNRERAVAISEERIQEKKAASTQEQQKLFTIL